MNVLSVTNEARKATLASEREAAKLIARAHDQVKLLVHTHVDALTRQMRASIASSGKVALNFTHRAALKDIANSTRHAVDQFASSARVIVGNEAKTAYTRGAMLAQQQLQALTPQGVDWHYKQFLGNQDGVNRAYKLFDGFGNQAADYVVGAIRRGVLMGSGPAQIARDINNALNLPLDRALNISRTESMRSLRDAALDNYRANNDVVEGWIWYASLGSACAACSAMSGEEFSLDEDMDSHNNCRCTMIPKTRSWADILGSAGIDGSDIADTSPDIPSGVEWFDNASETTQRNILGPAKYNAFKKGDITLNSLVGRDKSAWGNNIYEKSLSELGLDASDYL